MLLTGALSSAELCGRRTFSRLCANLVRARNTMPTGPELQVTTRSDCDCKRIRLLSQSTSAGVLICDRSLTFCIAIARAVCCTSSPSMYRGAARHYVLAPRGVSTTCTATIASGRARSLVRARSRSGAACAHACCAREASSITPAVPCAGALPHVCNCNPAGFLRFLFTDSSADPRNRPR